MKAKIIIENGETTIVLTPQNEFEVDLIEKVKNKKDRHNIHTSFDAVWNYGTYNDHKIVLSIKEVLTNDTTTDKIK